MYYFSDYTINIHKKSHKNILISYIGHVTLNYVKSLDLKSTPTNILKKVMEINI